VSIWASVYCKVLVVVITGSVAEYAWCSLKELISPGAMKVCRSMVSMDWRSICWSA